MTTTKTIKIQKNKILTITAQKEGFKNVSKSIICNDDIDTSINMINLSSQDNQYQIGDRLLGISSFVCYFTPSGSYDTGNSLKVINAKQTTGSSLSEIAVAKYTWLNQVETTLGVTTTQGTSTTFTFTYNGSNWDITGGTTQSGQTIADYGITFSGTPTSGDVITVKETYYNRFAVFVLDANYRTNGLSWGPKTSTSLPVQYTNKSLVPTSGESATFCFEWIMEHSEGVVSYPIFNYCRNKGIFSINNNFFIQALVPNGYELQQIYNNRVILDTFDTSGSSDYLLASWPFPQDRTENSVYSCVEYNKDEAWMLTTSTSSSWQSNPYPYGGKANGRGCIPIFELPCM